MIKSRQNNRILMPKECDKCKKNPSVYLRQYSGEFLCRKCFIKSIEYKAKRTISKYSMIKHGDTVAVAVSGGKDSLVLLNVLKNTLSNQNPELVAITIDEGIKGYRDESLNIVKNFCSSIGIKNKVMSFSELFGLSMDKAMEVRPSEKITSCSMCGTFRRRAIDLLAESCGANVIATGHNLDDYIQTFLINLFAGDVERIGWTYPEPVEYGATNLRKIKPLMEIYEREIVLYAIHMNIPFQSEECPYKDESIRSAFRNHLNNLEKIHPGIKYNAYSSILKIAKKVKSANTPSTLILNEGVQQNHRRCTICNRDSSNNICSVCRTLGLLVKKP
ncbi:MAG TPA: TIGR00269 family protein [Nitrososphaeraceae archaeon]|nr:TIGR00269 family protein [Nitrososphaeraceae archaeon]